MAVTALPGGEPTPLTVGHGLPPPSNEATCHASVRLVYRQTSAGLIGHFVGWIACTWIYWEHVPHHILFGWSLAFGSLLSGRFASLLRYERATQQGMVDSARWLRIWNAGAVMGAMCWSAATMLFYEYGGSLERSFLMLTVYSFAIGAVPYMASQSTLFLSCMGLYFGPMILQTAENGDDNDLKLAGIWCLLCVCTLALGRAFRRTFGEMVSLRFHAQGLAENLHGQMQAAQAAQREAEAASSAKTQFFAAASHDLRQPLHALGLFAEALRHRSRDSEVVEMVNSIHNSVDALEGLFSELLDITKIDAGGVAIDPKHFAMRDLFARMRLHFEPTAFDKGLMLSFHGTQHFAYADPLVVERILRNLIANAIRYTENGGVLVSCRRRDNQLLLQVWDTGIGIAKNEQDRIFDEFYQTQSTRPLDPHHRKGLGLGLAIVKRLAGLMGTGLTLRSRVGHGTVFSCLIPVGRPPLLQPASQNGAGTLHVTLDHRHIVVVEDDPSVMEGVRTLLEAWGATVSSFDSVRSIEEWLARTQGDAQAPSADLIMVDYRLPEQRTGIDALKTLRARLGHDVPAIVITGSTMTQLDQETRQHNFHVLLKPVVPNKFRAMIAFKLGLH
jgi:signal transduction histidine kinase